MPPEIIMGEAGICSLSAMIAVAYVFQRNPVMYGWQEKVSNEARAAALFWRWLPDTSNGARHMFSFADLRQDKVRRIIRGKRVKAVFRCKIGGLVFY